VKASAIEALGPFTSPSMPVMLVAKAIESIIGIDDEAGARTVLASGVMPPTEPERRRFVRALGVHRK
jgi:hypothetical protein